LACATSCRTVQRRLSTARPPAKSIGRSSPSGLATLTEVRAHWTEGTTPTVPSLQRAVPDTFVGTAPGDASEPWCQWRRASDAPLHHSPALIPRRKGVLLTREALASSHGATTAVPWRVLCLLRLPDPTAESLDTRAG
jgi:hypothetical protein